MKKIFNFEQSEVLKKKKKKKKKKNSFVSWCF